MSTREIVLLTRRPLDHYPVWEWVDANVRVIAAAPLARSARSSPVPVRAVEDYTVSGAVDLAVLDLAREREFDHLLCFSEYDVLRAARLREALGLPGQRELSAQAYRDKAVMKGHWERAGVPAARHRVLRSPADLLEFGREVGWPVVAKPRWGAGSVGVSVLSTEHAARRWISSHWRVGFDELSPWMAEAFVRGRMMQVDGVWADGRFEVNWPTWVSSLLAWADGATGFSLALEADDPVVAAAQRLVRQAVAALPDPGGPILYHAEVWQDERGQLLMNEIAARIGGGMTRSLVQAGFEVDLPRRLAQETVGEALPAAPWVPLTAAGEVGLPPRAGVVEHVGDLSALLSAPWVYRAAVKAQVGQHVSAASDSADTIAEAVVTGADAAEVSDRMELVAGWFREAVRYRSPDAGRAGRRLQPVPSGPRVLAGADVD